MSLPGGLLFGMAIRTRATNGVEERRDVRLAGRLGLGEVLLDSLLLERSGRRRR